LVIDLMKFTISSQYHALKLVAVVSAIGQSALYAGSLPVDSAPATGWHFGFDSMDFMAGGGRTDIQIAQATYTSMFDADFDTLPGEVSSDNFSLFTPILPLSNGRLRILTFLNYSATSFDTSVPNLLPEDTLQTIRLPIVALYDYSDQWLLGGMIMPGLSGDMDNTGDSFSFSAFAGFGYKAAPNLRWFGGVFYTDGFGDDLVTPGVGLVWAPSPDWSVNILPPIASISWRFNEDYFLSLFARYESTTWNVDSDSAGPARDVNVTSTRVGLRLERRLGENFWAQISAGYSLGREMEIESLGNATLQKDDIDPSPFIQIGLNLRY
jgi:hypothetical protein